jgi:hypothetical protein
MSTQYSPPGIGGLAGFSSSGATTQISSPGGLAGFSDSVNTIGSPDVPPTRSAYDEPVISNPDFNYLKGTYTSIYLVHPFVIVGLLYLWFKR